MEYVFKREVDATDTNLCPEEGRFRLKLLLGIVAVVGGMLTIGSLFAVHDAGRDLRRVEQEMQQLRQERDLWRSEAQLRAHAFDTTATRSAGANNLNNIAGYFTASGAQKNIALQTDGGDVILNKISGNTTIGNSGTTVTINGDLIVHGHILHN